MDQRIDAPETYDLLIERRFEAPKALVYRLWTDADLIKRWFGPKDFACPSYELDFRVGGRYRGVISAPQYGDNGFGGVIREIVPEEKIVMSFAWEAGSGETEETEITIRFVETDGATVQSFHQTPFADKANRDSHIGGWS